MDPVKGGRSGMTIFAPKDLPARIGVTSGHCQFLANQSSKAGFVNIRCE